MLSTFSGISIFLAHKTAQLNLTNSSRYFPENPHTIVDFYANFVNPNYQVLKKTSDIGSSSLIRLFSKWDFPLQIKIF